MISRRAIIKAAALAAGARLAGTSAFGTQGPEFSVTEEFRSQRPRASARKFVSEAVEAKIVEVKKTIADPELAWMFENCFPNTLDTTVSLRTVNSRPDTFVITGDINAMWLRDSAAQVWPYLPLAKDDRKLKALIAGVVNRQAQCILIDPYANAFNDGPTGGEWQKDLTRMKPELHERKWEIDSLCYAVRLAHGYWKVTGDASCFDQQWQKAMALVLQTFSEQQRLRGPGPYSFERVTSRAIDTVPLNGIGNPTRPCGLINSAFRPSDDACIFPYLIPSNLFAVTSLRQLSEIFSTELRNNDFARQCEQLASQVLAAVEAHATVPHLNYGRVYAYEVDGFGNRLFMDDSNVPSLLSLPYLGCCSAKASIYKNTRAFVLSSDNPYFFHGAAGEGIGGPHVGMGMIWPLGIIMRAMTSSEDSEITRCLRTLKATHASTGFMHEAFFKDDARKFTRPWFAWANTLFGELVLKIHAERVHLLAGKL